MTSAIRPATASDQIQAYLRQKWQELNIADQPFAQQGHILRVIGAGRVLYDEANRLGFDALKAKFDAHFENPEGNALATVTPPTLQVVQPPNTQLAIPTAGGELFIVPEGLDITDYMPESDNARMWRMVMGQPKNKPFPDGANQLYLTRPTSKIGADGSLERADEFRGPFGKSLTLYPVGYYLARVYLPPFNESPDADNSPLCYSEDFVMPASRHAGKFGSVCAHLDPRTGKLAQHDKAIDCPLARWQTKNGKRVPPPCQVVYRIGAVMELDGEAVLVKLSFKSIAAPSARISFESFNGLRRLNEPIWKYPITLSFIEKGNGNSYAVQHRLDLPVTPADKLADLNEFAQRWQEERERALAWARGTGEGDEDEFIERADAADKTDEEFPF